MPATTATPAAATTLSAEKQAILDQFISSPLAAAMIDLMAAAPEMSAEAAGRQSLDRWHSIKQTHVTPRLDMESTPSNLAHMEAHRTFVRAFSDATYQKLTA